MSFFILGELLSVNNGPVENTHQNNRQVPIHGIRDTWITKVNSLFKSKGLNDDMWDDLEEALILSDVGPSVTLSLLDKVRAQVRLESVQEPNTAFEILKAEVAKILISGKELAEVIKTFDPSANRCPIVILFVGVNGVGKTTTLAKMAHMYVSSGNKVIIGAADTFRAAAIEQIKTLGEKLEVTVIAHSEGSDPSAVVFDTIEAAKARKIDVALIDTAGRMHNSINLMDELHKMSRVVSKTGLEPAKIMLVLDATTGQNGLQQASSFLGSIGCDGIVLSKLDSSSKGGVILSVYSEFNVPVLYIGTGESLNDLEVFSPNRFTKDLFTETC